MDETSISLPRTLDATAHSATLPFLWTLIPLAAAAPPTMEPLPFRPFTIAGTCPFEVLVEPLTNKEKLTTFVDPEGNVTFSLITGPLKVRLTNTTTDQSVDLNISGPVRQEPQPDGALLIIDEGSTLIIFEPDVAPDLPRLALKRGRSESEIDAAENFTLLSVHGHVTDICAVLEDL